METGVQALVGEDMSDVGDGHGGNGQQLVGLDQGKLIEVLPDVVACALADECAAVGREVDGVVEVTVAERGARFAHGQQGDRMVSMRKAELL